MSRHFGVQTSTARKNHRSGHTTARADRAGALHRRQGRADLYGQRINGIVRVTDRSAGEGGRAYLVERGIESKAEPDALVADYLEQATHLSGPPMLVSFDRYF